MHFPLCIEVFCCEHACFVLPLVGCCSFAISASAFDMFTEGFSYLKLCALCHGNHKAMNLVCCHLLTDYSTHCETFMRGDVAFQPAIQRNRPSEIEACRRDLKMSPFLRDATRCKHKCLGVDVRAEQPSGSHLQQGTGTCGGRVSTPRLVPHRCLYALRDKSCARKHTCLLA